MGRKDEQSYGTFDVVLKGGCPWGIELTGGYAYGNRPVCISKVEPGGKAEADSRIKVGDCILRVNGIPCDKLGEASQMIQSAFYTLTLTLWRGGVSASSSDNQLDDAETVERGAMNNIERSALSNNTATSDSYRYAMDRQPKAIRDHNSNERYPQSFARTTTPLSVAAATSAGVSSLRYANNVDSVTTVSRHRNSIDDSSNTVTPTLDMSRSTQLSTAGGKKGGGGGSSVYELLANSSGFNFQPSRNRAPAATAAQSFDGGTSVTGKENRGPSAFHPRSHAQQPFTRDTPTNPTPSDPIFASADGDAMAVVDAFGFITGALPSAALPEAAKVTSIFKGHARVEASKVHRAREDSDRTPAEKMQNSHQHPVIPPWQIPSTTAGYSNTGSLALPSSVHPAYSHGVAFRKEAQPFGALSSVTDCAMVAPSSAIGPRVSAWGSDRKRDDVSEARVAKLAKVDRNAFTSTFVDGSNARLADTLPDSVGSTRALRADSAADLGHRLQAANLPKPQAQEDVVQQPAGNVGGPAPSTGSGRGASSKRSAPFVRTASLDASFSAGTSETVVVEKKIAPFVKSIVSSFERPDAKIAITSRGSVAIARADDMKAGHSEFSASARDVAVHDSLSSVRDASIQMAVDKVPAWASEEAATNLMHRTSEDTLYEQSTRDMLLTFPTFNATNDGRFVGNGLRLVEERGPTEAHTLNEIYGVRENSMVTNETGRVSSEPWVPRHSSDKANLAFASSTSPLQRGAFTGGPALLGRPSSMSLMPTADLVTEKKSQDVPILTSLRRELARQQQVTSATASTNSPRRASLDVSGTEAASSAFSASECINAQRQRQGVSCDGVTSRRLHEPESSLHQPRSTFLVSPSAGYSAEDDAPSEEGDDGSSTASGPTSHDLGGSAEGGWHSDVLSQRQHQVSSRVGSETRIGASQSDSTRRLKRAISANILPSRSGVGTAAAIHRQLFASAGSAAREAALNEYNEQLTRGVAPVSTGVDNSATAAAPRESDEHQWPAMVAAHQHYHSMSSLAAERPNYTANTQRSESYRPPQQQQLELRGSPSSSGRWTDAPAPLRRGSGGVRRVESYRVAPSAALADVWRPDERDKSKQEIRQSLLDFYMQKTRLSLDAAMVSGAEVPSTSVDAKIFVAPANILQESAGRELREPAATASNRASLATSSATQFDGGSRQSGATLRRAGSFSSVTSTSSRTSRQPPLSDGWSWMPMSSFSDGKFVSSHQESGKIKTLPVAEVSPFSMTKSTNHRPDPFLGIAADQATEAHAPVASMASRGGGTNPFALPLKQYDLPSPDTPPLLPPRNYRLGVENESNAKTPGLNYETMHPSDKSYDGLVAVTAPTVRMRAKVVADLPVDSINASGDCELDNEYRRQLRRASASQYKRASLSVASSSSQLSSPTSLSPTSRKSLHMDYETEPASSRLVALRRDDQLPLSKAGRVASREDVRRRSSCEVPLTSPQHSRQGSADYGGGGISSRSPAADEVFAARSSPVTNDAPIVAHVRRGGRSGDSSSKATSRVDSSPAVHTRVPSTAAEVAAVPPRRSSAHAHSASITHADHEVASVLQLVPEPSSRLAAVSAGSFKPISQEILENLSRVGISMNEKRSVANDAVDSVVHALAEDGDVAMMTTNPVVRHVRQKSSDELLCDSKMEILARSIEMEDSFLSRVIAPPEGFRQAHDYLNGVFDDVLRREHQRKARLSSGADKSSESVSPSGLDLDIDRRPSSIAATPSRDSMRNTPKCQSPLACSPCQQAPQQDPAATVMNVDARLREWLHNQDLSSAEAGDKQRKKDELVAVLRQKLDVLREEKEVREAALRENEAEGVAMATSVSERCSERDATKYRSYVDDVEKVTKLLLKLSRRLARAENEAARAAAASAEVSNESIIVEQKAAEQRRDSLRQQHEDAMMLKEGVDRQRKVVGTVLSSSLDPLQYDHFEAFIGAKVTLIMEHADVEDKIVCGEEQLSALQKALSSSSAS